MKGAALGIDAERRRLLGVERAEPAVRAARLAQLHTLPDKLDDVYPFFHEVEVTGHADTPHADDGSRPRPPPRSADRTDTRSGTSRSSMSVAPSGHRSEACHPGGTGRGFGAPRPRPRDTPSATARGPSRRASIRERRPRVRSDAQALQHVLERSNTTGLDVAEASTDAGHRLGVVEDLDGLLPALELIGRHDDGRGLSL